MEYDFGCFRGCGWRNCNRMNVSLPAAEVRPGVVERRECLWWHFHPDETVADLERAYSRIRRTNAL